MVVVSRELPISCLDINLLELVHFEFEEKISYFLHPDVKVTLTNKHLACHLIPNLS